MKLAIALTQICQFAPPALLLLLGFTPRALAQTNETVTHGQVSTTLTTQAGDDGFCEENARLHIQRAGRSYVNEPIANRFEDEWTACIVSDLQVQDLDTDGEPEVFLQTFSGGAHCCLSSLIYHYDKQQDFYTVIDHFWGNAGYQLVDLDADGQPEFETRDDSFAYAFTSYAGSRYPAQLWQFQAGELVNVTRQYPDYVYSHAYQLWLDYQDLVFRRPVGEDASAWSQVEQAALAAYLADKYLLNQADDGWQRVRSTYQWPDRQAFFEALRTFLTETGYIN
jgi:hypothetical protein